MRKGQFRIDDIFDLNGIYGRVIWIVGLLVPALSYYGLMKFAKRAPQEGEVMP